MIETIKKHKKKSAGAMLATIAGTLIAINQILTTSQSIISRLTPATTPEDKIGYELSQKYNKQNITDYPVDTNDVQQASVAL